MAAVFPNAGLLELIRYAIADTMPADFEYLVDLFSNQVTPVPTSVASDFEIPDFEGYEQVVITAAEWTVPSLSADSAVIDYSDNPAEWFNNEEPVLIYGYLVRSSVSNNVLWVEAFQDAFSIGLGNCLTLNISLQTSSLVS